MIFAKLICFNKEQKSCDNNSILRIHIVGFPEQPCLYIHGSVNMYAIAECCVVFDKFGKITKPTQLE